MPLEDRRSPLARSRAGTVEVVAVAVAAALAGCAMPATEPDGGEPPEDAAPGSARPEVAFATPLNLEACDGIEAVQLPPEAVRPHVPDDFDLHLYGANAQAILGFFTCGTGGAAGQAAAARSFAAIQVTPRDNALRTGDAGNSL